MKKNRIENVEAAHGFKHDAPQERQHGSIKMSDLYTPEVLDRIRPEEFQALMFPNQNNDSQLVHNDEEGCPSCKAKRIRWYHGFKHLTTGHWIRQGACLGDESNGAVGCGQRVWYDSDYKPYTTVRVRMVEGRLSREDHAALQLQQALAGMNLDEPIDFGA